MSSFHRQAGTCEIITTAERLAEVAAILSQQTEIAVDLEMECVDCLTRFEYPLKVGAFALQTELVGSETVDLTPFVREDIVLALPAHPHCDWDGWRACKGAYKIEETAVSPTPSAWDELDKLKAKTKK